MIRVENILVDESVITAPFSCDVHSCGGACCTLEGGRGAPLQDAEADRIKELYPIIREYLHPRNIAAIERDGLVEGIPGSYATTCIDHRECVFVYFDAGIARCGFERAFREGKTTWPKPISCHLFPIRVGTFGQPFVRYEQIDECRSGRELGVHEHLPLYKFLRDALIRRFGDAWYSSLQEHSGKIS